MNRIALALVLLAVSLGAALAQSVTVIGPITAGDCSAFNSTTVIKDAGIPCTGAPTGPAGGVLSGTYPNPGFSTAVNTALTGTNNQLIVGTGAFGFVSIVLGGDCTFTSPNITCSKVNGVSYGSSPSTDTVPVVTATNTTTYTAVPNCTTGVLQYSTSTHLFSCGAAGAGSVTSVTCGTGLSGGTFTTSGTCAVALTNLSNSIGANVALNNTANYFDGPSVAQGTTGTWFASGTVTLADTAGNARMDCKLWDGTTIIASAEHDTVGAASATAGFITVSLSGVLATPAANIRISCKDATSTSGQITFNQSGNSKDSTITVLRIQ